MCLFGKSLIARTNSLVDLRYFFFKPAQVILDFTNAELNIGENLPFIDSMISVYSVDGVLIKRNCKAEDLKSLDKGICVIVSGKDRYKISI